MSKYVVQPFTKPSYDLSYFMNFSPDRLKAVALMAEVGLPLYKIHHSIVIGDVALLIADGVEKLEGVKVDRYVCEMGALLHDVGISQIQKDDMPEHAFIGAQIARDAGYPEEVARCIELHDFAGLTKEYVEGANLPCVIDKDDKLPVTWEEKGKKYSAKEFVGVLKEYREDTETIVLSMDDREMETPVKEIALIRKYITF